MVKRSGLTRLAQFYIKNSLKEEFTIMLSTSFLIGFAFGNLLVVQYLDCFTYNGAARGMSMLAFWPITILFLDRTFQLGWTY